MAIYGHIMAIIGHNMAKFGQIYGFNYNFGRGCNFTSQFYVKKRVAIQETAMLYDPLKTKWLLLAILWPLLAKYYGHYWSNLAKYMGLIIILGEDVILQANL